MKKEMPSYKLQCLQCNELFPESLSKSMMVNHIEYYHKNLMASGLDANDWFTKRKASDFEEEPHGNILMFSAAGLCFAFMAITVIVGYNSNLEHDKFEALKQDVIKMDCTQLNKLVKDSVDKGNSPTPTSYNYDYELEFEMNEQKVKGCI